MMSVLDLVLFLVFGRQQRSSILLPIMVVFAFPLKVNGFIVFEVGFELGLIVSFIRLVKSKCI